MTFKEVQDIGNLVLMIFGVLQVGHAVILKIRQKPSFEAFVTGMLFMLMGKN